jgi:hypothetical protein
MANLTSAELGTPTATFRSQNFREVYASHLKMGLTPYDFVITLGHPSEQPPGTAIIEEDVVIRLSPQFCKHLSINLAKAVETWESQFGDIKLPAKKPEDVLAAIQAAFAPKTL